MTYVASRSVSGTDHMGSYNFTGISATNSWFESTVSMVVTTALNNTVAKCADIQSETQPGEREGVERGWGREREREN